MSRKPKHEEHANHERWLVSYADFITLMFAFFVVMFAASQTDKGRAKQVSESVREALEEGQVSAAVAKIMGNGKGPKEGGSGAKTPPDPHALDQLKASLEYLQTELRDEIKAGKLRLRLDPRGLVVSLTEAAFFPSGEDTISTTGYGSIDKIAVVIKKLPNPVRLEGHTDSIPIHNPRFRSNWELSAARGIAMLALLHERCGVPESQLAVAGYADTSPVDTNDTQEGRAHNRRVDVVILNQLGNFSEPVQAAPAASKAPSAQAAGAAPHPAPAGKPASPPAPAPQTAPAGKPASPPPPVSRAAATGKPAPATVTVQAAAIRTAVAQSSAPAAALAAAPLKKPSPAVKSAK